MILESMFYGSKGGATPSGTVEITENGTYDVSSKAAAEVSVDDFSKMVDGSVSGSVEDHKATQVVEYAFLKRNNIASVEFTEVSVLGAYSFYQCANLEKAYFDKCIQVGVGSFNSCPKFGTLVLRGNSIASLRNANAFTGTLIEQGTGYIYVPDDLVDGYKAASNWTTYAAQIKPLSEV